MIKNIKHKQLLIAVALTSALLVIIASLSYLISKNHEAISRFFGNQKKDEIALLEEKIKLKISRAMKIRKSSMLLDCLRKILKI